MSDHVAGSLSAGKVRRRCIFTPISFLVLSGGVALFLYAFLLSTGYAALAVGSFAPKYMVGCSLLSMAAALVSLLRRERCLVLAVVMIALDSSVLALASYPLLHPYVPSEVKPPAGTFGTHVVPLDSEKSDTFVRAMWVNDVRVGSAERGGPPITTSLAPHLYLPYKWHPGLSVEVSWERCANAPVGTPDAEIQCRSVRTSLPIDKYEYEAGRAWLHILPDDKAQLIVGLLSPGELNYPGPEIIEPGPNDPVRSDINLLDHDPGKGLLGEFHINGEPIKVGSDDRSELSWPYRWREGMTARVSWSRCSYENPHQCRSTEKVIPVEEYSEAETPAWIHLMPGDQVLLIKSSRSPGDADYPGPSFEDELEAYEAARRVRLKGRE